MKKVFLLISIFLLAVCIPAKADVLKAKAVDEISTASPKEFISVKLVRDFKLNDQVELKKGYVLTGKMLDIKTRFYK